LYCEAAGGRSCGHARKPAAIASRVDEILTAGGVPLKEDINFREETAKPSLTGKQQPIMKQLTQRLKGLAKRFVN
jgi:hypothetical protein